MKEYNKPQVKTLDGETEELMAGSGVTSDGTTGIGYGGIDTSGNKEPAANTTSVWDEGETITPSVWDK